MKDTLFTFSLRSPPTPICPRSQTSRPGTRLPRSSPEGWCLDELDFVQTHERPQEEHLAQEEHPAPRAATPHRWILSGSRRHLG